jgi:hypothetical protein
MTPGGLLNGTELAICAFLNIRLANPVNGNNGLVTASAAVAAARQV